MWKLAEVLLGGDIGHDIDQEIGNGTDSAIGQWS